MSRQDFSATGTSPVPPLKPQQFLASMRVGSTVVIGIRVKSSSRPSTWSCSVVDHWARLSRSSLPAPGSEASCSSILKR